MSGPSGLHAKLERFPIDKDLVGRETATGRIPKTLRPIFRDHEDFTAGHTLNEQTLAALDASAALIVLCSPASAKSHYVNEELRLFKTRHPDRPLIPVIVGGTPDDPKDECFAPALKFKVGREGEITTAPEELLAADVSEEADGRSLAIAKTVARLLDLQTDDVFRRAERERRRQGRVRSTIGSVIFGLMAAGGFLAWQSHQRQQIITEVEAIVAKYSIVSPAEAAVPDTKESLTKAITAIAEGAAGDARYAKALELLKAGKPAEAEPLLLAVAEEKESRAARESKQAAAAYENLGAITRLSALRLLQCRLAWYGFRSVKVGQLRQLSERTLFVDLLQTCGTILCTVEIDPLSGAIRRPQGLALVRLLASLGQAELEARPLAAAPMAN